MSQVEIKFGLNWFADPAFSAAGPLSKIVKLIPRFERMQCGLGANENPFADLIFRMPLTPSEHPIPVAMVSKSYALIQHTDVVDELLDVLEKHQIPTANLNGTLTLSALGQRMCLTVDLPSYNVVPKDHNSIGLQVNCFNSVDYTISLKLRLGWFRFVCQNGMVFGDTFAYTRRNHFALSIQDFHSMFAGQIESYEKERSKLLKWQDIPMTLEQINTIADAKIATEWGVHAAARVCHIARTGYDGTVQPSNPRERRKPHERVVSSETKVPGFSATKNAFDLLQVLSWVAGQSKNLQEQMSRVQQINSFMETFVIH